MPGETNPPMLHIEYDSGYFKTMVAILLTKEELPVIQLLLKNECGKILVTEVKRRNIHYCRSS